MAARSVRVHVRNDTGAVLTKVREQLPHGRWVAHPPDVLEGTATWSSESHGVLTGTEGMVSYSIAGVGTASIHWNNPFVGQNTYSVTCSTGFAGDTAGGDGDSATVDVRLFLAGAIVRRRPFYAVAHRINSPRAIAEAIAAGANAIECDVRRTVVDHDAALPWSTRLEDWMSAAATAVAGHPQLALIYFDIKEPDAAGEIVAAARRALPASVSLLFSIASFANRQHLTPLVPGLRQNEGIAIDEHDVPADVDEFFGEVQAERTWYGNGIMVPGPPAALPVIERSLREAITLREQGTHLKKVAVWTLRRRDSMQQFINLGVDAILVDTDVIPLVLDVVAGSRYARLATRQDPAFSAS